MSEGFESLHTALIRVNPRASHRLGEDIEFPILGSEQMNHVQSGVDRFPEHLSAMVLSYAVGPKSLLAAPIVQRVSRTFVDERCHGAGMTALKLVDDYVLQVDPSVVGLPAFAGTLLRLKHASVSLGS